MRGTYFAGAMAAMLAMTAHALFVESILLDPRYSNTASESIAYITNRMVADGVESASLALVDSNRVVWLGCFGDENRTLGIPVSTATVFRIGSCSKVFTTLAALQVCDQGALSLTTTVRQCLPGFSLLPRTNYPSSDTITLRHLLNHHSGIPGDLYRHGDLIVPFDGFPSTLLSYLPTTYPLYPPDLVNSYCNTAFTIAGRIVDLMNTSGVSFVSYCDQNIFTPLGMRSTSFAWNSPGITNHLAVVHDGSTAVPAEYVNAEGSGSMYSTPGDMAQFLMAILAGGVGPHGRLLSSAALAAMLTPQGTNLPLNVDNYWIAGLGWDSVVNPRLDYAGRVCFKTGVTSLFSAYMEALRDQQLAAAFIHTIPSSSLSVDGTDYLLRRAVRDKAGIPIPPDAVPVGAPPTPAPQALLDAAAGTYVDNTVSIISATNGTLTWLQNVTTAPMAVTGLVYRTNGWFSIPASQDTEIRFTNLAGRFVMIRRDLQADRSFIRQTIGGERVVPPPFSAAWTNRLNRAWPLLDEHADLYACVASSPSLRMQLRSAGTCLVLSEFLNNTGQVLVPENDTRAFIAGMVKRVDAALQYYSTNGLAVAQFAGSYYLDPDTISVMDLNSSTSGAVVLDYASALYAVDLASNAMCEALVTMAPSTFQLAVLDDACFQIGATNANAVLPFIAPHAGRYYLKVQATTSGPPTGSFVLALQVPEPGVMFALFIPVAASRLHRRFFTNTNTRRCE
ncbi:MAG: serine hydrolase [bacterium]|nr:serine hydrolase [bacterium]